LTSVPARRRVLTPDGVELAVFAEGDPRRPAVLLVHGYPDTHRVWDRVAAELAAGHHVIRYDVRGSGASGRPASLTGYRLDRLVDDLFTVIDVVVPDRPVHVVGHDWGSIQAWHAASGPRASRRIASFTTISGPCLDHVGYWFRRRLARPTPRHLAELCAQVFRSWYIAAFQLPLLAPLAWRLGLARRWPAILRRAEGVTPRDGHPQPTLAADAVAGIGLYRANMRARVRQPGRRLARVPVQLITLTADHYVSPALAGADLDQWVPHLVRRTLRATHWSALTEDGATVAALIREFAAHTGAASGAEVRGTAAPTDTGSVTGAEAHGTEATADRRTS
jgi:pimeloyl-ACP methyl ester carboxylesterase